MQKFHITIVIIAFFMFSLSSCIKEAPLGNEADIESADIPNASENLQDAPTITNTRVTFRLQRFAGNYVFAPTFEITPGATINPASGTTLDFSEPQKYVVTSQDGQWSKTYEVSFIVDEGTNRIYDFENVNLVNGRYDEFYDIQSNGQLAYDWSSGNSGFNIIANALAAAEGVPLTHSFFPTSQTDEGYEGKGALLQTKETGAYGAGFNSPLAAGNLFIGDFVLTLSNTLESTHFGRPYPYPTAPKLLKGYFKYKKGDKFIVNNAPSRFTSDTWNAIGILFEKVPGNENYIMGDSTSTSKKIVMLAEIDASQRIEADQWTQFEIPFVEVNGKHYDPTKEYMFSIIFSSSYEGDLFNGAVGSKLWIDEVELVTE